MRPSAARAHVLLCRWALLSTVSAHCRKKGWKANLEKYQKTALQFLSSPSGIAVLVALALAVLLGVYGNYPQGMIPV